MANIDVYVERLRESVHEASIAGRVDLGMDVIVVDAAHLVQVMTLLRDDFGFDMLIDLSAVDWATSERSGDATGRSPRFDVNYQLYSLGSHTRLRVKVQLDDGEHVPTVTGVWVTADWHEREVYDFFGIVFDSHPNLRRILMPDEWIGHPLRKDYPVGGVPVEYKIEPAYVGENVVPVRARPASGGVPARLRRDRGRASPWTWTGPPASGVRRGDPEHEAVDGEGEE